MPRLSSTLRRILTHEVLPTDPRWVYWASVSWMGFLAGSILFSFFQTLPQWEQTHATLFHRLDLLIIGIFGLEYLLRLLFLPTPYGSSLRGRMRHAFSPLMLLDLLAWAPSAVALALFGTTPGSLAWLRALRLLRLVRFTSVLGYDRAIRQLFRALRREYKGLVASLLIFFLILIVCSGAIYLAESTSPESPFTSLPLSLWWSVVTLTTVGYGDMIPLTPLGKAIGGMVSALSVVALALPTAILGAAFYREVTRSRDLRLQFFSEELEEMNRGVGDLESLLLDFEHRMMDRSSPKMTEREVGLIKSRAAHLLQIQQERMRLLHERISAVEHT